MSESSPRRDHTARCVCGACVTACSPNISMPVTAAAGFAQLTSGAPAIAFATVPLDDYLAVEGELKIRASSEFGERDFCSACGTPLTMHVMHQPHTIDVTIATLDRPEAISPALHVWEDSRIAWFETRGARRASPPCPLPPRHGGTHRRTQGRRVCLRAGKSARQRSSLAFSSSIIFEASALLRSSAGRSTCVSSQSVVR